MKEDDYMENNSRKLDNKVDKLVAEGKIGRATGESIKLRSGVKNS